ncbi:hypothetical protein Bbelb_404290 [Branchiostoma belcheri]|nr:hypothetical protein Bbelb_404290 [Branchiostoma belcheri]
MDDGSGTIDLSPLATQGGIAYEDYYASMYPDGFTYSWNPCYAFSKSGCTGVAVCQVGQADPSEAYDLGVQENAMFQPDTTGTGNDENLADLQLLFSHDIFSGWGGPFLLQ